MWWIIGYVLGAVLFGTIFHKTALLDADSTDVDVGNTVAGALWPVVVGFLAIWIVLLGFHKLVCTPARK